LPCKATEGKETRTGNEPVSLVIPVSIHPIALLSIVCTLYSMVGHVLRILNPNTVPEFFFTLLFSIQEKYKMMNNWNDIMI
jgi:hypothetical protein